MGDARSAHFSDEIRDLLRTRLLLAASIILATSLLFLVRALFFHPPESIRRAFPLTLHSCLSGLTLVLVLLLGTRRSFCMKHLRLLEAVLFGSMVLFFSYSQYYVFSLGWVADNVQPGHEEGMIRTAALATSQRWCFLIVLYGVFIPNTWKRCALMAGAGALIPLGLSLTACMAHSNLTSAALGGLADMAIVLLGGVAVAIFGSYRIHELHQEAFRAQQLGQYQLRKRLGSGGMGEVYLAEHVLLRRPCAIKMIRPEQAGDPAMLERFEREVQATATLTHWNTVEIFDYGRTEDGTFYYVMEYLPGETLETLVDAHGPLMPGRAIHFLRQVCRALREAHTIGLLHRDIKPSNIIACTRGAVSDVAKLVDFGLVQCNKALSQPVDRLTTQGMIVGSPPFMSPEQAAGREDLDARSDLYSVGAVAYYLLTGQAPFVRGTAFQVMMAHAYEQVVPPSQVRIGLAADLEQVVLRCLEKKPEQRFADAHDLEKALAACVDAGSWSEEEADEWWQHHAHAPQAEQPTPHLEAETQPLRR